MKREAWKNSYKYSYSIYHVIWSNCDRDHNGVIQVPGKLDKLSYLQSSLPGPVNTAASNEVLIDDM